MSFRLVVTDSFVISGRGTVVLGTVEGATVESGQQVRMRLPDGAEQTVLITSIMIQQRTLPRAEPGDEIALTLRGVERPPRGTILESLDTPAPNPQTTLDDFELSATPTALPLLLLPLRLEVSFHEQTLRIRAYPDQIHVDSFDPGLTQDEVVAGRAFLSAQADGRSREEAVADLEATLGLIRARLVADKAETGGEAALLVESDGGLNRRAVARGLPEKLIAHGMAGGRRFTVEGRTIPAEVPVAPTASDNAVPGGGSPLDWMVDYDKAEAIGLALTLKLDDDAALNGLDWLYVFGLDGSAKGEQVFAELMRAHAGSDGAEVIEPLTPTKGRSQQAPVYGVKGAQPDGFNRLTQALGLDDALALSRPAVADSTALEQDLTAIVWESALRPALLELYEAGTDTLALARDVYLEQIHPFGPYPTLRIGDQPYPIAPVAIHDANIPHGGEGLLRQVGNAIRAAEPFVSESADISRARAEDPRGYPWMIDTLLRHPVGQHWRLRTLTAAEAYLTPLARAAGTQDAKDAAQNLTEALRQGRLLMDNLNLAVGRDARLHTAFGDLATPSICGPLVATGGAEDRTAEPLQDPGLLALVSKGGFWTERVSSTGPDSPYYDSDESGAEPLLRLFAEHAVLQVLADLAIAENHITRDDATLIAQGALDAGTSVIAPEAWHLRSRLAAGLEDRINGGRLSDIIAGMRPTTPKGQKRIAELKHLDAAIRRVNDASAGGTHTVFAALLDGLATRADIWLMAEAEAALERERRAGRSGVTIGAWSVLEEVRPAILGPTRHAAAPSQEFATTLGLIERARRGLATTGIDGAIRAELSGPRVAEAREILQLLQQGRALDSALSRRVAEKLNEAGRGPVMEELVASLPIEGGAIAGFDCDGLSFLERANFGGIAISDADKRLLAEVQKDLRAAMETLGELHLVEGAAALSQRRVDAAQAVLAGLSAGSPPQNDLSVLTPSSTGTTLDFGVAACVDSTQQITGAQDLRAQLNPLLAVLAERLLGPLEGTITGQGLAPLSLQSVELSALSLAHLAAPGTNGVDRLTSYVRAHQGLAEQTELTLDDTARATVWAAERLAATLLESRALRPDDFPTEANVSSESAATTSMRRAAQDVLARLQDRLPTPENATLSDAATLFAAGLIPAPDIALVEHAQAVIEARVSRADAASDDMQSLAELLGDMPAMPSLLCGDRHPWEDGRILQGAARAELFVWLEESQTVRSRLAPIADLMLGAESRDLDIHAIQWPGTLRPSRQQQVDWIGAQLREDDVYAARSSLVVLGGSVDPAGSFTGLLLDTWQEVVPDDTVTAGIVVDSPTPTARPPQLIVLTAPRGDGVEWKPASLLEALETTVAIARMRTVGLGSLPEQTSANGVFGRLGQLLPVGAIRATDTSLARTACPPVIEE